MKQALVILAIRGFVVGALFGGAMGYLASDRGETAPPAATTPAMTASPRANPEGQVTPGSGPGAAASPAAIHRHVNRRWRFPVASWVNRVSATSHRSTNYSTP
jgi:hypothetical protein